jgi:hypothetical protein
VLEVSASLLSRAALRQLDPVGRTAEIHQLLGGGVLISLTARIGAEGVTRMIKKSTKTYSIAAMVVKA